MPVEIRELVIRAYADERAEGDKPKPKDGVVDRDEIVAECVEQVMEIMKRAGER